MSLQDLNLMTPMERKFASNPNNFSSQSDYEEYATHVRNGDNAHKKGDSFNEATHHRHVQEHIYGLGFDKSRDDSRHDYSWNSLYIHSDSTVNGLLNGGMAFDDAFTYDTYRHRYFLTKSGRSYCDNFGVTYFGPENKSANLVSPNIGYDTPSQSHVNTKPIGYGSSSNNHYGHNVSSGYTSNKYGSTVSYKQTARPVYSDEVEMFVG